MKFNCDSSSTDLRETLSNKETKTKKRLNLNKNKEKHSLTRLDEQWWGGGAGY